MALCNEKSNHGTGPFAGRLRPCPKSPNCVSTEDPDPGKKMAPIRFAGDAAQARQRLASILRSIDNARIIMDEGDYIHAQFTTSLFRFVDDVEFLIDEKEKLIRFRSASRKGYYDFGANRKRMADLTERFYRDPI